MASLDQRPPVPLLDFGQVFRAVFEDPDIVKKVAAGSLIWLSCLLVLPIPFALPAILGYMLVATRNAILGERLPLPEWSELGALWGLGIRYVIVMVGYSLPLFLVMVPAFGLIFGGAALGQDGEALAMAGVALFYVAAVGAGLFSLVLRFTLFPVAHITLAQTGEISSCFAFREMWETFRANPWNIMLSALVEYAGSFAITFSMCLCFLPMFPVSFLVYALTAVALGDAQRRKLLAYGELGAP